MGLTKDDVYAVLDMYIRAWEEQDPDLIVTIFTEAATYHERVLGSLYATVKRSVTTGRPRW